MTTAIQITSHHSVDIPEALIKPLIRKLLDDIQTKLDLIQKLGGGLSEEDKRIELDHTK